MYGWNCLFLKCAGDSPALCALIRSCNEQKTPPYHDIIRSSSAIKSYLLLHGFSLTRLGLYGSRFAVCELELVLGRPEAAGAA